MHLLSRGILKKRNGILTYCEKGALSKNSCEPLVHGKDVAGCKIIHSSKGHVIAFEHCQVWTVMNEQHQPRYGNNTSMLSLVKRGMAVGVRSLNKRWRLLNNLH